MPRLLDSANFLFQIFNVIGRVLLQFSKFLCSTVYSLPVINQTWMLVGWSDVHSLINTDGGIPALKTLPGKVFPQTLPRGLGLGSRLTSTSYVCNLHVQCMPIRVHGSRVHGSQVPGSQNVRPGSNRSLKNYGFISDAIFKNCTHAHKSLSNEAIIIQDYWSSPYLHSLTLTTLGWIPFQ